MTEYSELAYRDLVKAAFTAHNGDAKRRNIPFLLTYEQWCMIWMESGKWEQRGRCRGQYVMARLGDRGGYEIGNVVICIARENTAERNRNHSVKGERHPHYGKNVWQLYTANNEAAKEKHRKAAVMVAELRRRDARGCFVSEAISGTKLSK